MKWKVNRWMALWGFVFGFMATVTGIYILAAINGGFLAEGLFLLVVSWVVVFVIAARIVAWIRRRWT